MYKLITSAKGSHDLLNEIDREYRKRQNELTDKKIVNYKYHLRTMLKDVFGLAKHQTKATCGPRL